MDLSVVIPVRNEAGNIAPLVAEIAAALDGRLEYEIVYIDDGSDDTTLAEIRGLQAAMPRLRLFRHQISCGQSTAIRSGVKAARGDWIATLDGDGQNDPADIPALWRIAQDSPAEPARIGKTVGRSAAPRGSPMPCAGACCATIRRTPVAG